MFIKIWQLIILYIDQMDWRAGHLTTQKERGAGHLPTKLARRAGHLNFFSNARGMPGVLPGGGCSRLELTRTLGADYLISWGGGGGGVWRNCIKLHDQTI